jgi:hypothetical protein
MNEGLSDEINLGETCVRLVAFACILLVQNSKFVHGIRYCVISYPTLTSPHDTATGNERAWINSQAYLYSG